MYAVLIFLLGLLLPTPGSTAVTVDGDGVMRWQDSGQEVRLFGANYCAFSGGDYRMAGLVGADRKAMIDADMAHFARMGWNGMRLCSWGDWENSDADGNLLENDHSDLMDYLIWKAKSRGISILLTPIHTYDPRFADQTNGPKPPGFSGLYPRSALGTDPRAIAAETNYISQLLRHVNPYTGLALKDEPAIPFVEMINEPVHHPDDFKGSVAYIDALTDAVRSTGSKQLTFFNLTQDFRIGAAIAASKVDGFDFGWYPSGLVAGRTLQGNFLPAVAAYPEIKRADLAKRPRIVYEFDPADLDTGYMLPAMVRTFREVGAQFAALFAYDMLPTAPYNLGWQTHFINLLHTPKQAVSAAIAAEAMRGGDASFSYERDESELVSADSYMNAGDTATPPRSLHRLRKVVGFGSSPLIGYEGTGAYFLDKIEDGLWRLELYPDQVTVSDPFAQPRPDKVVSRLYWRNWPMAVRLPDLGGTFHAMRIDQPGRAEAMQGSFFISPGVWLLSRAANIDMAALPAEIGHVGLREFHVNPKRDYPDLILNLTPEESTEVKVRLAAQELPDRLALHIAGKTLPLARQRGADYAAQLDLPVGFYDYWVGAADQPDIWPHRKGEIWHLRVVDPATSLEIFNPGRDASRLSFQRLSEEDRHPQLRLRPGEVSDQAAILLERTAALYIGDRMRGEARAVEARFRGGELQLFLIEKDGSSWRAVLPASREWQTSKLDLNRLEFSPSLLIPTPFPGLWDKWRQGPDKGRIVPRDIERLELRVIGDPVEIESVRLDFTP
jgi:hypothetical protein